MSSSKDDSEVEHVRRRISKAKKFDPNNHDLIVDIGMVFLNCKKLKEELTKHTISNKRNIIFEKNDIIRVKARFKDSNCN